VIWETLAETKKPFFALAPMIDVTDQVFRQIVARCAPPDLFFTEFVSVESLASPGRNSMQSKLSFTVHENPLIVQIWGLDPVNYEIQCKDLATMGYAGIDINMGCPVSKVIQKGACSALINDRPLAAEIIAASKRGAESEGIPVSVKTRIGFHEIDLTWIEFLLQQHIAALTVHCRTVDELSKVPSHFDVLPEIVAMRDRICAETKIVANGDIATRAQGKNLAIECGVDGIMIGRGVFSDPYVFDSNSKWAEMDAHDRLNLFEEHIDLFDSTWGSTKNPEILKKFAKTYVVGFKGAAKVREHIMGLRDINAVREYLHDIAEDAPY
jgi:tRNA-dihydrouridine synthase